MMGPTNSEYIPRIFARLREELESPSQAMTKFLDYVQRVWIDSNLWTPAAWSVYKLPIRTNNDLEGWHKRLNGRGKANMNMFLLVELLHQEASIVITQVKLVSDGKLTRSQRKSSRSTEARLHKLWDQYEDRDLSVMSLLRGCAKIYGPRIN